MQSNKLGLQDNPQVYYYGCCIASCIYCTQRTFRVSRSKKIKPTSTVLMFIWGEREEYIRKRKRSIAMKNLVGSQKEGLERSTSQGRDQLPIQVAGKTQDGHKSLLFSVKPIRFSFKLMPLL